jgi:hypothetical protein
MPRKGPSRLGRDLWDQNNTVAKKDHATVCLGCFARQFTLIAAGVIITWQATGPAPTIF